MYLNLQLEVEMFILLSIGSLFKSIDDTYTFFASSKETKQDFSYRHAPTSIHLLYTMLAKPTLPSPSLPSDR